MYKTLFFNLRNLYLRSSNCQALVTITGKHATCNSNYFPHFFQNFMLLHNFRLPVGYGGVLNLPRFCFFPGVSKVELPLMGDTQRSQLSSSSQQNETEHLQSKRPFDRRYFHHPQFLIGEMEAKNNTAPTLNDGFSFVVKGKLIHFDSCTCNTCVRFFDRTI